MDRCALAAADVTAPTVSSSPIANLHGNAVGRCGSRLPTPNLLFHPQLATPRSHFVWTIYPSTDPPRIVIFQIKTTYNHLDLGS